MFCFVLVGEFIMQGDLYDHESLVKAIKQVDVVISTVGHAQLLDQDKLIAAIKEAGNVKVILILLIILIMRYDVDYSFHLVFKF